MHTRERTRPALDFRMRSEVCSDKARCNDLKPPAYRLVAGVLRLPSRPPDER